MQAPARGGKPLPYIRGGRMRGIPQCPIAPRIGQKVQLAASTPKPLKARTVQPPSEPGTAGLRDIDRLDVDELADTERAELTTVA